MLVRKEICAVWTETRTSTERHTERRGEGCTTFYSSWQKFIYLVLHEQDKPCHHDVDSIPQARILEQFGNLTSRETRKGQS